MAPGDLDSGSHVCEQALLSPELYLQPFMEILLTLENRIVNFITFQ